MSTEPKDIRWELRFANYCKALAKLSQAVRIVDTANDDGTLKSSETIHEMIREGLIQRFEYTHQLAWNVMKDYAEYQGAIELGGSRDATREAFKMGLITNAEVWMDMIKSRNESSHTYNEATAEEIYRKVVNAYHPLFTEFEKHMLALHSGKAKDLFDAEL
jgi:nucleotidyltransferase substrate binding protein (TIGR01987 family)